MKVIGLDGREYNWNYSYTSRKKHEKVSQHHQACREIIHEVFGNYPVLEEVRLPGSSGKKSYLYLDFFIPNLKIAIEVHGQQHYDHVPFFHRTRAEFLQAQNRDSNKAAWCVLNDITLIVLKYSGTVDEWKQQLREC